MSDILNKLDEIGADTRRALESFMEDEAMYLKYVCGFPKEPTMERLRNAVSEKDYAAAEKAVHALKGIVSNLYFIPLTDAAVDMLEELRDGNTDVALEAYKNVEEQYRIFCDVILAWQGKN